MIQISRLNYDKPHRCPTWSGGGWRNGDAADPRCTASFASFMYRRTAWKWRPVQCRRCGLVCLPYVTRWLDPTWLWWYFGRRRKIYNQWPYRRNWPI